MINPDQYCISKLYFDSTYAGLMLGTPDSDMNKDIINSLEQAGFSYAVAVATQAEIQSQAACGQLAMVVEDLEG